MATTNQPTLALPFIHLNGSSAKSLMEQYRAAYESIGESIKSLDRIDLHMRDYYPLPRATSVFQQAQAEMKARYIALEKIQNELMEIMLHVNEFIKH